MTQAAEILETLTALGATITVSGDRLRIEPANKIPADLIPRIREAKPELLAALRERPACHSEPVDPAPAKPCYACGSRLFWRSIYGVVICWHCHIPANDNLANCRRLIHRWRDRQRLPDVKEL